MIKREAHQSRLWVEFRKEISIKVFTVADEPSTS
jgi:hypothetical protein